MGTSERVSSNDIKITIPSSPKKPVHILLNILPTRSHDQQFASNWPTRRVIGMMAVWLYTLWKRSCYTLYFHTSVHNVCYRSMDSISPTHFSRIQWRPFIARFIIANILWSSILISLQNMLPFELTKDTPYLALLGELWSVFCEYFNKNWPCYKGFLLYSVW